MTWILTAALFALGLLLIIKGGDLFVDAAVWIAEKTGIPKLIIGATVVSLATTLPEMIVSLIAAGQGKVDMAAGNAVGSVTANLGLIMGIALICMPSVINRRDYLVKSLLMLGAALVLTLSGLGGSVGLLPGLLLAGIFAFSMVDNVRMAKGAGHGRPGKASAPSARTAPVSMHMEMEKLKLSHKAAPAAAVAAPAVALPRRETVDNILRFIVGIVGIVAGSQLLVDNGSALALLLGVPERIISVSVIAVGTSLPELITTISAISKKQASLSVGNIIGANIIDLTLILPLGALVAGEALPLSPQMAAFDIPVCLFVGCVALIPPLVTGKFHRLQGIILLVIYAAYMALTTVVLPG